MSRNYGILYLAILTIAISTPAKADLSYSQSFFPESIEGNCESDTWQINFGRSVFLGDFNGDGLDDLLAYANVEGYAWDGPAVYLSGGNGFIDPGHSRPDSYRGSLTVSDLNDDGYDDILAGDQDGYLHVYFGTPEGTPQVSDLDLLVNTSSYSVTPLSRGDIDGDGIDDVIMRSGSSPTKILYGFDHSTESGPRGPYAVLGQRYTDLAAYAGDVNGDGVPERIFTTGSSQPVVSVRVGTTTRHRFAWGRNLRSLLGDGTTNDTTTPLMVTNDDDWKSVCVGPGRVVAIRTDGTLWAWGTGVGDGTNENRSTPTQVGTAADWSDAKTGWSAFGLKDDGTLWGWGWNNYGDVGDGTTTPTLSPSPISGGWKGIYPGVNHHLGIKEDGTLWAWGDNRDGQLGDGTTIQRNAPVQVGTDTDWVSASGGTSHTVALKIDGTLWSWGSNNYGELGEGTASPRTTPDQVGTADDWVLVEAGGYAHNVALKSDGSLLCWGAVTGHTTPHRVGFSTDWVDIAAGRTHFLALTSAGTLFAMGYNDYGQLGDGTTTNQLTNPVMVGSSSDWVDISAGDATSAALTDADPFVWTIEYDPSTTSDFGQVVASAGDINGDGYGDIAVTDPWYDGGQPEGLGYWGRVYLWYGGPATPGDPSGLGANPTAASADIILSGGFENGAHRSFAAGDVDGDGFGDVVVGDAWAARHCWSGEVDIQQYAGVVRLYRSSSTSSVVVDPQPDIDAPWHLDGPDGYAYDGTGYQLLNDTPPGSYVLTWGPVAGWETPSPNPVIQSLIGDATITFQGEYNNCPPFGILYVDQTATGAGDGSSWINAFRELRDALSTNRCDTVSEIWVAAGNYLPTTDSARDSSFTLVDGVGIFGGFAGTETSRDQRDPEANSTILSGDIGVSGDPTDNSYHVLRSDDNDATAIIDGFTITGGRADGPAPHGYGGGILCVNGEPSFANLVVTDNAAGSGIGGGGMYCTDSSPTMSHIEFLTNSASDLGGGLSVLRSTLNLTDAELEGNSALQYSGGGIYAMYSDLVLVDVTFEQNAAGMNGGGLCTSDQTSVTMINAVFCLNSAGANGGGAYLSVGEAVSRMTNVSVAGNTAGGVGGGMYANCATTSLTNAILWDNTAVGAGSQISWINYAPQFEHCIIEGSGGSGVNWDVSLGTDGGNNLDAEPWFRDSSAGDLHLTAESAAIDVGDPLVPDLSLEDRDGRPRIQGGTVDVGAFEYGFDCDLGPVVFVDRNATGLGDGSSWTDALEDLDGAIEVVRWCDAESEIWVAAGTYKPTAPAGRGSTFRLVSDVGIYGGFEGSESDRTERDWLANPTTLSGDIGAVDDDSDNCYHVVTGSGTDSTAVLDGFTITGGNADGEDMDGNGAGVLNVAGSPTLTHLNITGNRTRTDLVPYGMGGGMYNSAGAPALRDVTFDGNTSRWGAGLYDRYSGDGLTVENGIFRSNVSTMRGGGVCSEGASPRLTNVQFLGNEATNWGAGLSSFNTGNPVVTNAVFADNATPGGVGGGICLETSSSIELTNASFCGNAARTGGGIYHMGSGGSLVNVIMWGDEGSVSGSEIYDGVVGTGLIISHSLVAGSGGSGPAWDSNIGEDGGGNLDADPLYYDADGGDLRCRPWSIIVDAGDSAAPHVATVDLDGNSRVMGPEIDLGAYEWDRVTAVDDAPSVPDRFALHPPSPNPFNPSVQIRFDLPVPSTASLKVYDIAGRLVRILVSGKRLTAARHTIMWDGRDDRGTSVASGVYIYQLETDEWREARRMTLVK